MGLFGRDTQPSPASTPTTPQKSVSSGSAVPSATTVVAAGTRVEGTLSGSGNIMVEGEVDGAVAISGSFHVAKPGRVKASIRAKNVTISGRVDGDISSEEKIQLEPTGVVHGNLVSPRILILDGAELQGQVVMSKPTKPESTPPEKKPFGDKPGSKHSENKKK